MCRILNVDFKRKRLQYVWEGDKKPESPCTMESVNEVSQELKNVLDKVVDLTEDDVQFQEYCLRTFAGVVHNLRGRIEH